MYHINFNQPTHVHFIGIGGISMSGLAHILLDRGFTVSGSDMRPSELTKELEKCGAVVSYSHMSSNITKDIDTVVYTAAISESNPELVTAKKLHLHILTRAQLLGQLMTNYTTAINVAGTHGKTTTTSMIADILIHADCDPTVSVGGILHSIGGNIRTGKSDIFLTEACEYTNSFLAFHPTLNVILNVKADHLDFFKDIDDIRHSFRLFNELLPDDGTLVINTDIDDYEYFYNGLHCNIITVGSNPDISKYSAKNIQYDSTGCCSYDLLVNKSIMDHIELCIQGIHNVYNSLAAIAVCLELGLHMDTIKDGLRHFTGADRRFQMKGTFDGVTVVDDYAHHPDEITATLNSALHYPHNRIWCVFQPHTYSRTKALLQDFAKALTAADVVVLADIYAAREQNHFNITSADLQEEIIKLNTTCYYINSFESIEKFLKKNCINGDLLITIGAGNVVNIGEDLISK